MDGGHSSRVKNGQPVIPDELFFEILTRVPAKSLLKFRCVSKFWLSMISSRDFIKAHLKNLENDDEFTYHSIFSMYSQPHTHLKQISIKSMLNDPKPAATRIDFPGEEHPDSASVLGCCNGLVCVVLDKKDLYFWNPCTRISKKLPDSGFMVNASGYSGSGFGYDESRDDYNVVLFRSPRKGKAEVVIYSGRTDSWRRIDGLPTCFPRSGSAIFVNGKLHWDAYTDKFERRVVSLDLARIEFAELQFPRGLGDVSILIIGVLQKQLCVNCVYWMDMDLWVMKEYGVVESWTKIATIPAPELPVCISNKGEILLTASYQFGLYNMGDQSLTHRRVEDAHNIYPDGDIYVESLVSPLINDDNDAERLPEQ